jgi:hypothetical protein
MTIYCLANLEEKEQIFKLRYRVYIEELGKNHIHNDNLNKIITDEYDEDSKYFFAKNQEQVCGALRTIIFKEHYLKKLCEVYKLPVDFVSEIDLKSIGFVDRFVIDKEFRNGILGLKIMKELYTYTINHGICYGFINAEKVLVHTYYQIGYRVYDYFYTSTKEKRYLMVCFMRDFDYQISINSPLTKCFNDIDLSDKMNSVAIGSKYFNLLKESEVS